MLIVHSYDLYGSFSWKLVKIVTERVKIQSVNFFILLFGKESLTSLVYVHKYNWQGDRNLANYALCYVTGQCLVCYRRHQKCMNRVGSVASLTLAFFIVQYFLINKGISVTSDIKKEMSWLFNEFGLKCLLRSTDMHEIGYTFLLHSLFSFPQSNLEGVWEEGGGTFADFTALHISTS